MRQINPLYISLLLVLVLMIVFIRLNSAKEEYNEAKNELKKTEMMGKRIVALKRNWGEDASKEAALSRVLKASILQEAAIKKKREGKMLTITSEKAGAKAVEFLLNKLLNGTFAVKSLKIRALSDEFASVRVEILL